MTLQGRILASSAAILALTLATALAGGAPWRWLIVAAAVAIGAAGAVWTLGVVRGATRQCVRELAETNRATVTALGEISKASRTLAEGAHEQEATIEQTNSSSSRLTSMTERNSKNATTAAEVMQETEQIIAGANQTLGDMVKSMSEINAASDKIARIIKVIDEIAFQTNILALNAAVEAARAGEAGMGFAVVADEVRGLAQRSAQAAKDTAAMIEESIAKSVEGSRNLDQVKEAILAITGSASRVKTLVDEVSAGSQEQAQGIGEITAGISQLESVTHNAASGAEQSATVVSQLETHAGKMSNVLARLDVLLGEAPEQCPTRAAKKPSRPDRANPAAPVPAPKPVLVPMRSDRNEVFPLDDDFR